MQPRQPKQTYNQIIVNHMLTGETISTYQAYDLYSITCLAQRISDLRALGVVVKGTMTKRNGKRFMQYWIDEADREQAKELTK